MEMVKMIQIGTMLWRVQRHTWEGFRPMKPRSHIRHHYGFDQGISWSVRRYSETMQ